MLDVRLELESYQPIHLESVEESSGKLSENVEEAIHLFNKALDDARTGNEDMAIIALKKALSLHPSFNEAMNVLGICYVAVDKEDMAEFAFKQVIDADDSSIKALEYLNKMKGLSDEKDRADINLAKRKNKVIKPKETGGALSAWLMKGLQKENANNLYGLKYIVGILIGACLILFIWYMVPTNKSLFTLEKVENILKDPDLEKEIERLNVRVQQLEKDIQTHKEDNQVLSERFQEYKEWVARLEEADNEFKSGNFLQAADFLSNAQQAIPDDLKSEHKTLWDQVRLQAANQLYLEGNSLYNGNTAKEVEIYKQALVKFESAITYLEEDRPAYMTNLYYQAGKTAARSEEIERAVELFEAIISEYPGSQYSSYAATRLREINEGRPISGN